jgi:hypothetical protein
MMGLALLIVGWMSTLGFVATGIVGFGFIPQETYALHMLLGLSSAFLLLFSHCWIMFYLIGTGKAIKEAVADHDLGGDAVQLTKDFKNLSYPWMMLAMALAMATFIIGAGVHTQVIPAWVHSALYFVTIVAQLHTLRIEHQVLRRNRELMASVSQRIAGVDRG